MAIWNASALNTNMLSGTFNQLFNTKALDSVRKNNGLLYAILGKRWIDNRAPTMPSFERLDRITGSQVEVRLLGKLATISAIVEGSGETASSTPNYDAAKFGAAVFPWTHYASTEEIPSSEYERIRGDEAKTINYIDDVFNYIMLSLEAQIGNDMNSNQSSNAMASNYMGTWQWAVSDGVTAGESGYATYGTITRADSANTFFRGNVFASVGDLTLGKVQYAQNTAATYGGDPKFGIAPLAIFTKIRQLLEQYGHWNQNDVSDEGWLEFGGVWSNYGGIKFILEDRSTAGTLGLIDPTTWTFYMRMVNFTDQGFVRAPHLVAAYVLPWECWTQLICTMPTRNAKLTGINA